jgi:predicted dehydrogenase
MSKEIRVGFVGAGAVNFGGGEGPWDHASRLETIDGLRVVGVADPDGDRARSRLAERSGPLYEGAEAFTDYRVMLDKTGPDAVWIGVPPNAHGTAEKGLDMEVQCASRGIHMFVEKPLSNARPDRVAPVAEALEKADVVASVGYMFRYSGAIERMRALLDETPGGARVFVARYNCAYSEIRKAEWWDVRASGGPIVEQATHFVDLARYVLGNVDVGSVRGVSIAPGEPAGELSDVPLDDDGKRYDVDVPVEFRAPRATAAVWQFLGGGVGSLTHATLLHREKYETELEVWGDGLHMALEDPYGRCRLRVRRPHSETTDEIEFGGEDPYLAEDRAFVEAVRTGDRSLVRSPYSDALKTFELTWAIRDAAGGPS